MTWRRNRKRQRKAGVTSHEDLLSRQHLQFANNSIKNSGEVHPPSIGSVALQGYVDRMFDYHSAPSTASARRACTVLITSVIADAERRNG